MPEKGRVRNFAWIGPERKHVHLGFEHGTLLADPEHVLQGAQEQPQEVPLLHVRAGDRHRRGDPRRLHRAGGPLAVMPSAVRRALAETAAEPVSGAAAEVPPDWELVE